MSDPNELLPPCPGHGEATTDPLTGLCSLCTPHKAYSRAYSNARDIAESDGEVARLTKIKTAAQALITKLEECKPYVDSAFVMAYHVRGGTYDGPSYHDELVALTDALDAKEK